MVNVFIFYRRGHEDGEVYGQDCRAASSVQPSFHCSETETFKEINDLTLRPTVSFMGCKEKLFEKAVFGD